MSATSWGCAPSGGYALRLGFVPPMPAALLPQKQSNSQCQRKANEVIMIIHVYNHRSCKEDITSMVFSQFTICQYRPLARKMCPFDPCQSAWARASLCSSLNDRRESK